MANRYYQRPSQDSRPAQSSRGLEAVLPRPKYGSVEEYIAHLLEMLNNPARYGEVARRMTSGRLSPPSVADLMGLPAGEQQAGINDAIELFFGGQGQRATHPLSPDTLIEVPRYIGANAENVPGTTVTPLGTSVRGNDGNQYLRRVGSPSRELFLREQLMEPLYAVPDYAQPRHKRYSGLAMGGVRPDDPELAGMLESLGVKSLPEFRERAQLLYPGVMAENRGWANKLSGLLTGGYRGYSDDDQPQTVSGVVRDERLQRLLSRQVQDAIDAMKVVDPEGRMVLPPELEGKPGEILRTIRAQVGQGRSSRYPVTRLSSWVPGEEALMGKILPPTQIEETENERTGRVYRNPKVKAPATEFMPEGVMGPPPRQVGKERLAEQLRSQTQYALSTKVPGTLAHSLAGIQDRLQAVGSPGHSALAYKALSSLEQFDRVFQEGGGPAEMATQMLFLGHSVREARRAALALPESDFKKSYLTTLDAVTEHRNETLRGMDPDIRKEVVAVYNKARRGKPRVLETAWDEEASNYYGEGRTDVSTRGRPDSGRQADVLGDTPTKKSLRKAPPTAARLERGGWASASESQLKRKEMVDRLISGAWLSLPRGEKSAAKPKSSPVMGTKEGPFSALMAEFEQQQAAEKQRRRITGVKRLIDRGELDAALMGRGGENPLIAFQPKGPFIRITDLPPQLGGKTQVVHTPVALGTPFNRKGGRYGLLTHMIEVALDKARTTPFGSRQRRRAKSAIPVYRMLRDRAALLSGVQLEGADYAGRVLRGEAPRFSPLAPYGSPNDRYQVGGESRSRGQARPKAPPRQLTLKEWRAMSGTEVGTVRAIALEEQRKAGWDAKWPFVPIDLSNERFRRMIAADPKMTDEEKGRVFSAGVKLGVIGKDQVPKFETPSAKAEPRQPMNMAGQPFAMPLTGSSTSKLPFPEPSQAQREEEDRVRRERQKPADTETMDMFGGPAAQAEQAQDKPSDDPGRGGKAKKLTVAGAPPLSAPVAGAPSEVLNQVKGFLPPAKANQPPPPGRGAALMQQLVDSPVYQSVVAMQKQGKITPRELQDFVVEVLQGVRQPPVAVASQGKSPSRQGVVGGEQRVRATKIAPQGVPRGMKMPPARYRSFLQRVIWKAARAAARKP